MLSYKTLIAVFIGFNTLIAAAQSDKENQFSGAFETPCFKATKRQLIQKFTQDTTATKGSYYGSIKITHSQLQALSITEKLVYALDYPEEFFQVCYYIPKPIDSHKRLFKENIDSGNGLYTSKRQLAVLKPHQKEVGQLISDCISQSDKISNEVKSIILKLDLYTVFPAIINYYLKFNDTSALNLLTQYMTLHFYIPFTESTIYQALQKQPRNKGVLATKVYIDEILTHAKKFYQWKLERQ